MNDAAALPLALPPAEKVDDRWVARARSMHIGHAKSKPKFATFSSCSCLSPPSASLTDPTRSSTRALSLSLSLCEFQRKNSDSRMRLTMALLGPKSIDCIIIPPAILVHSLAHAILGQNPRGVMALWLVRVPRPPAPALPLPPAPTPTPTPAPARLPSSLASFLPSFRQVNDSNFERLQRRAAKIAGSVSEEASGGSGLLAHCA
ncbi:hypothetical protein Mp_7g10280 [Marchantia polymorpha subsp. ruderalis]|uniref:Uncharacterized protein n=2 Tax=Marchantia polymorpha TaxID=3197 RepID=A0AAF6BY20_MARPO|nr:hypothetical protein MARPO_0003s0048 [Marchantia polymorpha]BBN16904.1 hypothetical protein Mp_7g10280 [Marchantia polymorpha subsp. ruderalis]|eukprot:PTQ49145.1 hypothetical protein MARPO_0003s0048 [Marchantia polymorpha]